MRIAQIVCAYPPYAGGIAGSAQQIEQIFGRQHEVVTFSPQHLKPWLRYGHGAFLPQLFKKLRGFDYIYLHYPFFGTAEVVWFFKLFYKRPQLIVHYHMDVEASNGLTKILSWPSKLIRSSLLKRAHLIVSASLDYIENSQIRDDYRRQPEKFREIPFGLDLKKFQPKTLNRPLTNKALEKARTIVHYINAKFIKQNRVELLFVGALDRAHYFKGVEVLLQALLIVRSRNWRLKIVGDGDLRSEYEALARRLKLDKQVEFSGKLLEGELRRSFQNADLFILPSINRNEAFGIVLIEALACGVPVIASDLPGVRQVFKNGEQGLLAKPNDVRDLQEKLELLINNPNFRRKLAKKARQLAEEKYDLEKMATKLLALF